MGSQRIRPSRVTNTHTCMLKIDKDLLKHMDLGIIWMKNSGVAPPKATKIEILQKTKGKRKGKYLWISHSVLILFSAIVRLRVVRICGLLGPQQLDLSCCLLSPFYSSSHLSLTTSFIWLPGYKRYYINMRNHYWSGFPFSFWPVHYLPCATFFSFVSLPVVSCLISLPYPLTADSPKTNKGTNKHLVPLFSFENIQDWKSTSLHIIYAIMAWGILCAYVHTCVWVCACTPSVFLLVRIVKEIGIIVIQGIVIVTIIYVNSLWELRVHTGLLRKLICEKVLIKDEAMTFKSKYLWEMSGIFHFDLSKVTYVSIS